ncbi:MAG TPA: hypothetical protein VK956_20955 [Verrucomicrobium sp.]|nr:hypothetical protein [Verrucomicrobium sp.]
MAKNNTLYAYAVGSDLGLTSSRVVEEIASFIASREWLCPEVWSVNHTSKQEGHQLGIRLELPGAENPPPGWFEDVEAVVQCCTELREEFGHDFIVGISDPTAGDEDVIEIDSDQPDVDFLRKFTIEASSMRKPSAGGSVPHSAKG